jgi:hypothetical protein
MATRIIHCSYHKCLSRYYGRVMSTLYNHILRFGRGYRHFSSLVRDFYQESGNYRVASVNNHALDLGAFDDFRISRFVRDPRDLVVSGYFYHKRGAETWCNVVDPSSTDWTIVNGCLPQGMAAGHSFSTYLASLSPEDGLIAEIDFRESHFNSMLQWPTADPRVKVFRYEDVIGNEQGVFDDIFRFYGVSRLERMLGAILARHYSAEKQAGAMKHIRNPEPGQWRRHFTPRVSTYFEQRHRKLLEHYGYE